MARLEIATTLDLDASKWFIATIVSFFNYCFHFLLCLLWFYSTWCLLWSFPHSLFIRDHRKLDKQLCSLCIPSIESLGLLSIILQPYSYFPTALILWCSALLLSMSSVSKLSTYLKSWIDHLMNILIVQVLYSCTDTAYETLQEQIMHMNTYIWYHPFATLHMHVQYLRVRVSLHASES